MSLIKKDQIKYGKDFSDHSVLSSSSQKFQLNLSIPRDKIEAEISLLKNELMKEAEHCRFQLDKEKELFKIKEKELEEKTKKLDKEKNDLFSDLAVTQEKARKEAFDIGYLEGNKNGYADGLNKGDAEGRADHDNARKAYENSLYDLMNKFNELDQYKNVILANTEPYLLSLLDVIVKKLLSRSIELDKNIMLAVVREALVPVTSGHELTIKVNPENVQHLEENKSKLLSEFMTIKECNIVGDCDVSEGGCLIEANFGVIDSRIESKMQSIKDLIATIKDADEVVSVDLNTKNIEIKEDNISGDDLFNHGSEVLSFDENIDDKSFDFLTDDDE